MRHGRCSTCLWWWLDLHGSGERICYNWKSPFFHKVPNNKGCIKHEDSLTRRKYIFSAAYKRDKEKKAHEGQGD